MLCTVRSEKGCWVQDRDLVTGLNSEPSNAITCTTLTSHYSQWKGTGTCGLEGLSGSTCALPSGIDCFYTSCPMEAPAKILLYCGTAAVPTSPSIVSFTQAGTGVASVGVSWRQGLPLRVWPCGGDKGKGFLLLHFSHWG